MGQHALHGVARLLASDAQVLLQGARHGWEHGLRCFLGVHGNGGTCNSEQTVIWGESSQTDVGFFKIPCDSKQMVIWGESSQTDIF